MADELIAYATYQFHLNRRQQDGATLKQHLESAYRQTGVMPEELADEPDLPYLAAHVWYYFLELHRTRSSNGFGENPLSYAEIECWCRLTGIVLEQWELQALVGIDGAYLQERAKEAERKSKSEA